mgnify:FL=1
MFNLLIPNTLGETETLRSELPDTVSMENAVFHLSRMIHVPKAFEQGDIHSLRILLQDKLHENVRYRFIPEYKKLLEYKKHLDEVMVISGSGPSVLLIGDKDLDVDYIEPLLDTFKIVEPTISQGVTWEVL